MNSEEKTLNDKLRQGLWSAYAKLVGNETVRELNLNPEDCLTSKVTISGAKVAFDYWINPEMGLDDEEDDEELDTRVAMDAEAELRRRLGGVKHRTFGVGEPAPFCDATGCNQPAHTDQLFAATREDVVEGLNQVLQSLGVPVITHARGA